MRFSQVTVLYTTEDKITHDLSFYVEKITADNHVPSKTRHMTIELRIPEEAYLKRRTQAIRPSHDVESTAEET